MSSREPKESVLCFRNCELTAEYRKRDKASSREWKWLPRHWSSQVCFTMATQQWTQELEPGFLCYLLMIDVFTNMTRSTVLVLRRAIIYARWFEYYMYKLVYFLYPCHIKISFNQVYIPLDTIFFLSCLCGFSPSKDQVCECPAEISHATSITLTTIEHHNETTPSLPKL